MPNTTFFWLLALLPSLPLLLVYWAFRRVLHSKKFEMRMLLQRGETLTKYLSAYGGTPKGTADKAIDDENSDALIHSIVDQIFQLRYSSAEYIPAIVFNVSVTFLLIVLAFSFAGIDLGLPSLLRTYLEANTSLRDIVAGGIGALSWGIYESCERYRSGDLPPDVIFSSGARILLIGAVGAVVGVIANDRLAWPIAFFIGVLPTSTIRSFLADQARKALHIPAPAALQAYPQFDLLQGWNSELSEKLARAEVFSVQELACSNQFQLFLRSNLEWRVILDLSDQALLALYIGQSIEKLRPLGIRSAVELAEIDWSREDKDSFFGFTYDEAIKRIAESLDRDEQSTKLLVRSVAEDATVNFLGALWSDDTPEDDEEDEEEDHEEDEEGKGSTASTSASANQPRSF